MTPYFDEIEQAITPSPTPTLTSDSSAYTGLGIGTGAGSIGNQTTDVPPTTGSGFGNATETPVPNPTSTLQAALPPIVPQARKPRETKYLIDKRELSTITNAKCRAMVDELKGKVPVALAPYACALLLRSLQEMSAEIYLEAFSMTRSNKAANIAAAANHLLGTAHATDPGNRMALATSFKTSSTTYQELCETAHSTLSSVSADHVRATWKNLGGGMDLLWKRIHAQATTATNP